MPLPLRDGSCDLRSGSGLTANWTNLPNASELCLAFNWVSRSSRPALCYRPLLAFPPHFAMLRVTQLEPRTPHQPEKLKKLSKNDFLFTLSNSVVNKNSAPLSDLFSIECSPSTGR